MTLQQLFEVRLRQFTEAKLREVLRKIELDMYLDYFNNYLSLAKFAEDYGLSESAAQAVIDNGRKLSQEMNR